MFHDGGNDGVEDGTGFEGYVDGAETVVTEDAEGERHVPLALVALAEGAGDVEIGYGVQGGSAALDVEVAAVMFAVTVVLGGSW